MSRKKNDYCPKKINLLYYSWCVITFHWKGSVSDGTFIEFRLKRTHCSQKTELPFDVMFSDYLGNFEWDNEWKFRHFKTISKLPNKQEDLEFVGETTLDYEKFTKFPINIVGFHGKISQES